MTNIQELSDKRLLFRKENYSKILGLSLDSVARGAYDKLLAETEAELERRKNLNI